MDNPLKYKTKKPICLLYLWQVKPEELREFHNVAFIDASVNSLSLGDN